MGCMSGKVCMCKVRLGWQFWGRGDPPCQVCGDPKPKPEPKLKPHLHHHPDPFIAWFRLCIPCIRNQHIGNPHSRTAFIFTEHMSSQRRSQQSEARGQGETIPRTTAPKAESRLVRGLRELYNGAGIARLPNHHLGLMC